VFGAAQYYVGPGVDGCDTFPNTLIGNLVHLEQTRCGSWAAGGLSVTADQVFKVRSLAEVTEYIIIHRAGAHQMRARLRRLVLNSPPNYCP